MLEILISVILLCTGTVFPQTSEGIVKLKVGVMMGSGDVKPVARTDFHILTKDLKLIFIEAALAQNLPVVEPFEDYIDKKENISEQLRTWVKKNKVTSIPILYMSSDGEPAKEVVTFDDLFEIPEFHNWIQKPQERKDTIISTLRGFPKYPKPNKNQEKYEKEVSKFKQKLREKMKDEYGKPSLWILTMLDFISKENGLDYDGTMWGRASKMKEVGRPLALNYSIKIIKTSLSGDAEFTLPSGTYWISNIEPTKVGLLSIVWNKEIVIEPDKTVEIELSNDNFMEMEWSTKF